MAQPRTTLDNLQHAESEASWSQVIQTLSLVSPPLGITLHQRIAAVTQAQTPSAFVEALVELDKLLNTLDYTELLSAQRQLPIKNYVLRGWATWRASFTLEAQAT